MEDRLMSLLGEWAAAEDDARADKFDGYVYGIAQARFVIRHVFRLVDAEAKQAGLEPLQHQALLQVFGSPEPLTISGLADRLDIASTVTSRIVNQLERRELVARGRDAEDKRITTVQATTSAREVLRKIDAAVHQRVEDFQASLSEDQRRAALMILTFYVGLGSSARLTEIMHAPDLRSGSAA